jgi:SAM-dependent methyltransferase
MLTALKIRLFFLLEIIMKRMLFTILTLVLGQNLNASLNQYLHPSDKRYASFELAKKLIKDRELTLWVETGTARNGATNCVGDGCSTIIYSDFLKEMKGKLYSVDIDPKAIALASKALKNSREHIYFNVGDSIQFLNSFEDRIDFLYLDSYDFDFNNPHPSQYHHLKEIEAAYDKLHDQSVVMIDDCDLPHGGKGTLAIKYLLDRGWSIVYKGYQVILVKNV